MGVYPGFTADQFGQKHQSVNYGVMLIGFALAGLIGPSIASMAYAQTGQYRLAFQVSLILCSVGIVLAVVYRCVAPKYRRANHMAVLRKGGLG